MCCKQTSVRKMHKHLFANKQEGENQRENPKSKRATELELTEIIQMAQRHHLESAQK
jgi:hypothetical protein